MNRKFRRMVEQGGRTKDTAVVLKKEYYDTSTGRWYSDVNQYIREEVYSRCEEVMKNRVMPEIGKMLAEGESYIAVINIMIMLVAIERTVGSLKTVQKSYQKILDAYNDALDYVDQNGAKEVYEEFHNRYGIAIDFDEMDLSEMLNEKTYIEFLREVMSDA